EVLQRGLVPVASLLRDDVDDAALGVPVLGREPAREDLELLDGEAVDGGVGAALVGAALDEGCSPRAVDVPEDLGLVPAADGVAGLAAACAAEATHDGLDVEEHAGLDEQPLA